MKRLFYIIATILLACNSSTAQKNMRADDAPPLYTISDLQKEGLKGKIKAIIYSNYQSAEMVNNRWIPTEPNYAKQTYEKRLYNQQGFLTLIETEEKESFYGPAKWNSTDSFFYLNGILKYSDHYSSGINEEGRMLKSHIAWRNIFYWITPYSYKVRWINCLDGICDSLRYNIIEHFVDKNYRHTKQLTYSGEDSNKVTYTILIDYSKDYTNKTMRNPGGKPYRTETILQRDDNNSPTQVLYNDEKETYMYDIRYEYYQ